VFRKVLDGLPNDFQFSQRGVLAHALVEEGTVVTPAVPSDVLECVADVLQIRRGRLS
jgi:hypothetical protein